jgi:hypothetical protein
MNRLIKPIWTFAAEGGNEGGDGAETGADGGATPPADGAKDQQEQTFKQADVDRIVAERLKREREATKTKYADYDDLKAKADGAKTAEERIATLEQEIETTKREALKRRVQAAHQISDEDADLFLTGADEESLTAQAKRLAERESDRKKSGNHVPNEGRTPQPPKPDEKRAFANFLTGHGRT